MQEFVNLKEKFIYLAFPGAFEFCHASFRVLSYFLQSNNVRCLCEFTDTDFE